MVDAEGAERKGAAEGAENYIRMMIAAGLLLVLSGCFNPYECLAEYRFAEYRGRLGVQDPLTVDLTARDSGRIYFSLDETRGVDVQRQVTVSVNVWSFADSVADVHVHERTGSRAGRLLFSTSSGLLVRDSVWNGYPQLYSGPVSWSELWEALEDDNAYLEVHPAEGQAASIGRLTLVRTRGFQPSCT